MPSNLNEVEQLVLLALARLGDSAYGVTIRQEIEERSGRPVSIAAVYNALDRLERRGTTTTWLSDPTPERGGRARKHFAITPAGEAALKASREMMDRMWDGLTLGGRPS
jgi:PadR family transcriptional regulator PadR